MTETRTVRLGAFAVEALAGKASGAGENVADDVVRATRFYLGQADGADAGWAYPDFLRERVAGEQVELELTVDDSLWRALSEEARRQDVSEAQLLEHVSLYYAAELDAGRVTERILDRLNEEEEVKDPG